MVWQVSGAVNGWREDRRACASTETFPKCFKTSSEFKNSVSVAWIYPSFHSCTTKTAQRQESSPLGGWDPLNVVSGSAPPPEISKLPVHGSAPGTLLLEDPHFHLSPLHCCATSGSILLMAVEWTLMTLSLESAAVMLWTAVESVMMGSTTPRDQTRAVLSSLDVINSLPLWLQLAHVTDWQWPASSTQSHSYIYPASLATSCKIQRYIDKYWKFI